MTEARIMPERRFYGEVMYWLIRSVVTDYSGNIRRLARGERYLGAFIVPPFQRPPVWTEEQKVRLIESLFMGLPVGAIVYNQVEYDSPCDRWLLDGQQRVTAITEFMRGEFRVNGWRYPDLPNMEQRHLERIGIGVIETRIRGEAECRDIYDRLAYGGTPHTAAPDGDRRG